MFRTRILGTWLAVVMLGACVARWQNVTPQSSDRLTLDSKKTYVFVLANGDTLHARHASVAGDSIHWTERVRHGAWVSESGGVQRTEIRQVAVYAGSGVDGGTVGVGLLAGFALLLLSILAISEWPHHF